MVMSTVLFYLIVAAKRTMYTFGLCFCVCVLITPVLKYLILLAKQAFVCKTLIIIPPPHLPSTEKQCSLGVGGNNFYRGCSLTMNCFTFDPLFVYGKQPNVACRIYVRVQELQIDAKEIMFTQKHTHNKKYLKIWNS